MTDPLVCAILAGNSPSSTTTTTITQGYISMEIITLKLEHHLDKLDKCSEEEREYHLTMVKAAASVLKRYAELD